MNLRDCLVRFGIVDSPRVCRLPLAQQLFFRNILHAGDGAGRFKVDPDDLRDTLYRHARDRVSRTHIQHWLAALHTAGLVRLYTGPDGAGYCELLNYGQRDTKRRVMHPGPDDERFNFAAVADPPDPPAARALGSELKENQSAKPATADAAAKVENFSESLSPNAELGNRTRAEVEGDLFLAMCAAEGSDPAKLTSAGRAAITRGLSQIRRVSGGLTSEMIARAAAAYRKKFPTADLTAHALAKHWARLDTAHTKPAQLMEPEPNGWRNWINENTPDAVFARGGDREGAQWSDLDAGYRRYLIEKLTGRSAA